MNKYERYKKVDLPWLEEVPEHWELAKINTLFEERREKVSDKDFEPLSVTKMGILKQLTNVAKTSAGDNRKKVLKDDFVINSRSDRKGSSGVSDFDGSVSLINTVLKIRKDNSKFVHYLLRSVPFQEEFYRNGKGIVADLWSTNYQAMKGIYLPIPPLAEQEQIAAYLDWKINEIDRLIAVEKEKIRNFQLIGETILESIFRNLEVTERNLNKFLKIKISDGPHETPTFVEDGIPFVSAESVEHGKINLEKRRGFISQQLHEFYCKKIKPQKDDIFIVKSGSTTGKIGLVDFDDEFSIWSPLAVVRVNKDTNYLFMYYQLKSEYFQEQIRLNWSFGTQPNIGMKVLEQLKVRVPKLEIQESIAKYCKNVEDDIKKLLSHSNEIILNLEDFKNSLISEVVTGKIDVRNVTIPSYEKVDVSVSTDEEEIEE